MREGLCAQAEVLPLSGRPALEWGARAHLAEGDGSAVAHAEQEERHEGEEAGPCPLQLLALGRLCAQVLQGQLCGRQPVSPLASGSDGEGQAWPPLGSRGDWAGRPGPGRSLRPAPLRLPRATSRTWRVGGWKPPSWPVAVWGGTVPLPSAVPLLSGGWRFLSPSFSGFSPDCRSPLSAPRAPHLSSSSAPPRSLPRGRRGPPAWGAPTSTHCMACGRPVRPPGPRSCSAPFSPAWGHLEEPRLASLPGALRRGSGPGRAPRLIGSSQWVPRGLGLAVRTLPSLREPRAAPGLRLLLSWVWAPSFPSTASALGSCSGCGLCMCCFLCGCGGCLRAVHVCVCPCVSVCIRVCPRVSVCIRVCVHGCVPMCLCPYVSVYIHVRVCQSVHPCVSVCAHVCVRVCPHACVSVRLCPCLCVSMCVSMCLCVSVYVFMCVSPCVCVPVVSVSMCISVCVHMRPCISVSMCVSVSVHVCLFMCISMCICVCSFVCVHVCVPMCLCPCVCLCVCPCASVCVCVSNCPSVGCS